MKQFCKRFMVHLLVIAMVVCALPVSMIAMKANAETTADATAKLRIYEGRQTGFLDGKAIYLQTDGMESAPYDSTMNLIYEPVQGEGGIYYHDTLVGAKLRKYGENAWFLDINYHGTFFRQMVKGESLTIKGKFQGRASSSDAYFVVNFEEVTFRYEGGTTWSEVFEPASDADVIRLSDFNIGEQTITSGENAVTPSSTYAGTLENKHFQLKVSRSEESTGITRIYYGDAGRGTWKNYGVDFSSSTMTIRWWGHPTLGNINLGSHTLSKYGVDATKEMLVDLYLEKVNKDGDEAYDANLIIAINGILIDRDNVVEDMWDTITNHVLIYSGDNTSTTISNVILASDPQQITLTDFNISDGLMTNSTMNSYSAGIAGKEIVLDVTHTVDAAVASSNTYARMYVGTTSDGNGYVVGLRKDHYLIVFNASGSMLSNVYLPDLGIANGDTFQLKLLFTWIDADNDGNTNDANLDVYVNGTAVGAGSNIQKDATDKMNNSIRFYMNAGHTLKVESVQSKQTIQQISIDDFGIDNGTYGNAQSIVTGTCNTALAGKCFRVEITPHSTTGSSSTYSWIYYASKSEGSQTGFRIGIRGDGYLIIHNLTSITSGKGVTNGSMLAYPTLNSLGLAMDEPFVLEAFLDFVDYDTDGNKDDAYIRVKVGSSIILEDNFVDAALNIGNALDIWCHAGNTVKLNQVLDVGEVANPFRFTGVDEDSYIDADGNAVIEIKPSIGIPGNPDVEGYENVAVYTGLPVLVGDATESATYAMTKTDHGTFKFIIQAAEVPSLPFTVTLQKGAMKNADETVELNLTSDYVVCVNQYGISGDEYITCAGEDVALTYSSGDVNGIYLTATDSMTVSSSNIYVADDKNSGFFLNGERHQEVYLRKNAEGTYYVALKDVELTPEVGDVAILTGKWELGTVFVDFASIALKYNGSSWETLEANSLPHGQITLSDFGIDDGEMGKNQKGQYAGKLEGTEVVLDVTHTNTVTSGQSSSYAYIYFGSTGGGNGYRISLSADGYIITYNFATGSASGGMMSPTTLKSLGVTQGNTYRMSLKYTFVDSDGDGQKNDVNLDMYVDGKPVESGKLILKDAKSYMGNGIYFYPADKHALKVESVSGTVVNGGGVSRDTADGEWLIDGKNATVNGVSAEQGTVLYKPGDYVINSQIGDVTMSQKVSLYHPGDVNSSNSYEVADLVRVKKHQGKDTADTVAGQLAADKADISQLRATLLGKTKADDSLPTEIIGATSIGTYITSVDASANGTTVIGMADSDNAYQANADKFDDYGFDYVIDYNNDRPIKILQLTDTQTIDSSQERYEDRLGVGSEAEWAPTDEVRNSLLFNYIDETVKEAKPDLILLTGDIVYGEFDDNGENFKDIVEYMDGLKIPWAPVYGNHENESRMGVEWQNEQLTNSPYCLFNVRHEIEGNGNYTIGISHNGTLERVVYMMDSNGVYSPWWEADKYKDTEEAKNADTTVIKKTQGFSMKQKNWYRSMALRTNDIAGKTIPSILGYHIGSIEYLEAAKAACYQTIDSSEVKYTIGVNVTAQPGDSGYKGNAHVTREEPHLLDYMHEVGTDGTFIGHQHSINTSVYYDGIRWTYGVKTGKYCDYPSEMGGTLINLSQDSSTFEVERIIVKP